MSARRTSRERFTSYRDALALLVALHAGDEHTVAHTAIDNEGNPWFAIDVGLMSLLIAAEGTQERDRLVANTDRTIVHGLSASIIDGIDFDDLLNLEEPTA